MSNSDGEPSEDPEVRRLGYFHVEGEEEAPHAPALGGNAARSIFTACFAAAAGIASGLNSLNPYTRPAVSLVIGLASLFAVYSGVRGILSRPGYVEHAASVIGIALGMLCVAGAIVLFLRG